MSDYPEARVDALQRLQDAYAKIDEVDRPEIWITLREQDEVAAEAQAIEARRAAGEDLPLAGYLLAVKDNIDAAGLPTTAGCPAFSYEPSVDAPAVGHLRAAGAVVIGKTNLDQFATGLVGTRSPHGAVRDAHDPSRVSGGSSSGSAVAVALGIVDVALGTDTAGSGRVPAAFQGIVGVKPTKGLVSNAGVVPACRSFDCVSVFARTVRDGALAAAVMAGPRQARGGRRWPSDVSLAAPPTPRVGVPQALQLEPLSDETKRAFADLLRRLEHGGWEIAELDLTGILESGLLLYEGAFVAERFAAVGPFIRDHPDEVDPTVSKIITAAMDITADRYVHDLERLDSARLSARETLEGLDALLLPTVPFQPTIAAVAADPLGVNRRLGTYTNFCNLLDMCALAVPAGRADGGHFGVTVFGGAFDDHLVLDLASRLTTRDTSESHSVVWPVRGKLGPPRQTLFVLGAHMSGGPLNHELTSRGGRLLRSAATAPGYRLYRLATTPPKPGLVRDEQSDTGHIVGELWAISPAGLASLLDELPNPMVLGRVELDDKTEVVGFLCEPAAIAGALEISAYQGWRAYLQAEAQS